MLCPKRQHIYVPSSKSNACAAAWIFWTWAMLPHSGKTSRTPWSCHVLPHFLCSTRTYCREVCAKTCTFIQGVYTLPSELKELDIDITSRFAAKQSKSRANAMPWTTSDPLGRLLDKYSTHLLALTSLIPWETNITLNPYCNVHLMLNIKTCHVCWESIGFIDFWGPVGWSKWWKHQSL